MATWSHDDNCWFPDEEELLTEAEVATRRLNMSIEERVLADVAEQERINEEMNDLPF